LSPSGITIKKDQFIIPSDRNELYRLILDYQKEEARQTGKNLNIPPDLILCLMKNESKFDIAAGKKGSSHVGLGQMGAEETRLALERLKKFAPNHFKALKKKIQEDLSTDVEETLLKKNDKGSKEDREKEELRKKIARSNAAFSTLTSAAYIQLLAEKNGGSLVKAINGYKGGGDGVGYDASGVVYCMQNSGWRQDQDWVKAEAKRKNLYN